MIEKIFDLLHISDQDEDEDDDLDEYEEIETLLPEKDPIGIKSPKTPAPQASRIDAPKPDVPKVPPYTTGKQTNQFKLVVIEPANFDESPRLVDSLKAKKPVIINLENLETDVARKIFDFLSGATYALNGNVQKVANNIFVFAPENVDVAYNMNQKASEQVSSQPRNPWR
ncbi:MAG TPA: cell division protein SepF [Bacillota bacterium]|nr:cell division protein SepF [Bacillota bacterium]